MFRFLRRITSPAVKVLANSQQADDFLKEFPISLVITSEILSNDEQQVLENVALKFIDLFPVGWAKTTDSITHINEAELSIAVISRKYDQQSIRYNGEVFF